MNLTALTVVTPLKLRSLTLFSNIVISPKSGDAMVTKGYKNRAKVIPSEATSLTTMMALNPCRITRLSYPILTGTKTAESHSPGGEHGFESRTRYSYPLITYRNLRFTTHQLGDAEGTRLARNRPSKPPKDSIKFAHGFSSADNSSSSAAGEARLRQEYRSPAAFDEVKRFYLEKVPGEHWQYVRERALKYRGRSRGERSLEFRQGEYGLDVRDAGERAGELGWNYAVTVRWDRRPSGGDGVAHHPRGAPAAKARTC